MKGKFSKFLIFLMSISLAGIIGVQWYWIREAFKSNEENFSYNVQQSVTNVSERLKIQEFFKYFHPLKKSLDSIKSVDANEANQFVKNVNRIVSDELVVIDNDAFNSIQRIMDHVAEKVSEGSTNWSNTLLEFDQGQELSSTYDYEFVMYESLIDKYASKTKISQRLIPLQIETYLEREFSKRDINVPFEYAVFKNSKLTSIQSKNYKVNQKGVYIFPLFVDVNGAFDYSLAVSFNGKKKYLFSSIALMALLSFVLTIFLLGAYLYTFFQFKKQRKLSEIKTDFINNITHELKTPIATVKLALDTIKNPKIIENPEIRSKYLGIIREENERIDNQVEKALELVRISSKNMSTDKKKVKLSALIHEAIDQISSDLLASKGELKLRLNAENDAILANKNHFVKALINIIDNAIKYTDGVPKVEIITENAKNSVILRIIDQGIGMTKENCKKIFSTFFRAPKGNLHNIKGVGLGLSYVKKTVDDHQGQVVVKSEKGKGTIFIIKVPLIS